VSAVVFTAREFLLPAFVPKQNESDYGKDQAEGTLHINVFTIEDDRKHSGDGRREVDEEPARRDLSVPDTMLKIQDREGSARAARGSHEQCRHRHDEGGGAVPDPRDPSEKYTRPEK